MTFVIHDLVAGGAERVVTMMANYWAGKGWPVTVITLGKADPFFGLHDAVVLQQLGSKSRSKSVISGIRNNMGRIRNLRRHIRETRPDVVISFLGVTNVLALLATAGLRFPVVVSERNNPVERPIGGWAWRFLRRVTYRRAAALVVQTRGVLECYPQSMRRKARVIPNPVERPPHHDADELVAVPSPGRDHIITAMGKMTTQQKGFDLLLKAFAQVADKHPQWSLVLWGDGPLRTELQHLRDSLNLTDRVELPGRTRAPAEALGRADLFVLPSRYEGFPNVLCEAMACGIPVVAFDCPYGPSDIIRDQVDGILVPPEDVDGLAEAMDHLMSDGKVRARLGSRAPEVTDRFALNRVMGIWEELLDRVRA